MTLHEALSDYFVEQGLHPEGSHLEDWLKDRWYRIGGVPVLPLVGRIKESLILHDIHHLITGYSTRWAGELELAGWELGSGGCARHWFFWFDRIFTLALGLVMAPVRTTRALRRGTGAHNLYRRDYREVLASDLGEVRRYVGYPMGASREGHP